MKKILSEVLTSCNFQIFFFYFSSISKFPDLSKTNSKNCSLPLLQLISWFLFSFWAYYTQIFWGLTTINLFFFYNFFHKQLFLLLFSKSYQLRSYFLCVAWSENLKLFSTESIVHVGRNLKIIFNGRTCSFCV